MNSFEQFSRGMTTFLPLAIGGDSENKKVEAIDRGSKELFIRGTRSAFLFHHKMYISPHLNLNHDEYFSISKVEIAIPLKFGILFRWFQALDAFELADNLKMGLSGLEMKHVSHDNLTANKVGNFSHEMERKVISVVVCEEEMIQLNFVFHGKFCKNAHIQMA